MIKVAGLDWSSWNTITDYQAVKNDPGNYKFVFVKATEGTGYRDPYQVRWDGAGSIGLLRSCYHFYRGSAGSPSYQASYFCNWATKGELPPVLDFEDTDGVKAIGGVAMLEGARAWLAEVTKLWGVKPIVYSGLWYLQLCWGSSPNYDAKWLAEYPLWIANYTTSPDVEPLRPSWWPWKFYQWTSSGVVAGQTGRADLNVFNGDENQLRTWAGLDPVDPPTPPTDIDQRVTALELTSANHETRIKKLEGGVLRLSTVLDYGYNLMKQFVDWIGSLGGSSGDE